jgi:hypothetical protein
VGEAKNPGPGSESQSSTSVLEQGEITSGHSDTVKGEDPKHKREGRQANPPERKERTLTKATKRKKRGRRSSRSSGKASTEKPTQSQNLKPGMKNKMKKRLTRRLRMNGTSQLEYNSK